MSKLDPNKTHGKLFQKLWDGREKNMIMIIRVVTSVFALPIFMFVALCQAQVNNSQLIQNLEAGKKQVIVAYGTSLTARGDWVTQLDRTLNKQYPGLATVVNSGGPGMWSKWGVDNFDARVIQKNPDTIFIEFCINDSVARFDCSVERAQANLENMIERMLKSNPRCEIILMTMTPGDKYPEGHQSHRKNIAEYYDMYRSIAKQRGLLLIDHYPNWKALQTKDRNLFATYVPDSIHPTADGDSNIVTPVLFDALGIKSTKSDTVTK